MKIYLAAPWARRQEAQQVRDLIVASGHIVTARWMDGDDNTDQYEEAKKDIIDIGAANAFVVLNLQKSEGKAWEQGYAYALGLPIVVVGGRLNVFQHLTARESMYHVETINDALALLEGLSSGTDLDRRPASGASRAA